MSVTGTLEERPHVTAPYLASAAEGTLPAGTLIDHYKILDVLGRGGMGVVYGALDFHLDRQVAIKVASSPVPRAPERFAREARALAALSHPNIVTIHDLGRHVDRAYIVMELLRGETLRARLRRALPSLPEALAWACDVLRALAAAHEAKIAHLDLKPENLFLTDGGALKVLDFGVARLIQEELHGDDEAAIAGTLPYMAPEQLVGGHVDERTDLFAFGLILYELVIGEPIVRRRERGAEAAAIPATQHGLMPGRELAPSPPAGWPDPEVERVVRRCLATSRSDRPTSAVEILAALEGVLGTRTLGLGRLDCRHVETSHGHLTYHVLGEPTGADVVVVPGMLSRLDMWGAEPEGAAFLSGLSERGRLILFDRCGLGASDRVSDAALPSPDDEVEHLDALLDAVGSDRCTLVAMDEGAPLAILYAALRPARVQALALIGGRASYRDQVAQQALLARAASWGKEGKVPPRAEPQRIDRWLASWERTTATPRTARVLASSLARIDVAVALPYVDCPVWVVERDAQGPQGAGFSALRSVAVDRVSASGAPAFLQMAGLASSNGWNVLTEQRRHPASGGGLSFWLLTDARRALVSARNRSRIVRDAERMLVLRFDRLGPAVRECSSLVRSGAPNRVALVCDSADLSAEDVAKRHPAAMERARPGRLVASPAVCELASWTLAATIAAELGSKSDPPVLASATSSNDTFDDVARLVHRAFTVEPSPGLHLRIAGSINLRDPERLLIPHFRRIHERITPGDQVVVDIRALKYVNSSGLGLFLSWIGWIGGEHEARRYRLDFVIDPTVPWQRTNFAALSMLAPDVVRVSERSA